MAKKASIRFEKIRDLNIDKFSASDFLSALDSENLELLKVFPEKKKYELELEPDMQRISFDYLVKKLKSEKKKIERDIPDFFKDVVNDKYVYEKFVDTLVFKLSRNKKMKKYAEIFS